MAELPSIYHVIASWAELVALSPVLNTFDGSEVEILNEIPEYEGAAGFVGTVLALFLVAVGAVKKIFQTSEENARRKRSDQEDIYLDIIQILDRQKCVQSLLCSVAQQSIKHKLPSDKRALIQTFGNKPNSIFNEAISLGKKYNSSAMCFIHFNQCPLGDKQLIHLFKTAQKFRNQKIMDILKKLWLKLISNKQKDYNT